MSKYTIEVTLEEGKLSVHKVNDGFNVLELIGIVDFLRRDLYKQFDGTVEPDIIKREVINPEEDSKKK